MAATETQQFYTESIQKAILFLEANASENILLQDIAAAACISPFHFHRIFKAYTHSTTKQYLTRLRLEKAAHLLQHTPQDIAPIAFAVGYDNHETFSRAFKSYFDVTPSQFRQNAAAEKVKKHLFYDNNNVNFDTLRLEKPTIQHISTTNLAYIRHTGSYENVAKTWQKLMFWGLKNLQFGRQTSTLGIVHDNPNITDVDNIRYDACLVVKNPINPKGGIGFKQIKGGKYAVFRYKGMYDDFYNVYDYIYSVCLLEYGYLLRNEPAVEWYVKSPPFYKPENYVTDFYVPIE